MIIDNFIGNIDEHAHGVSFLEVERSGNPLFDFLDPPLYKRLVKRDSGP